jgi:hypothetical protein
MIGTGTGVTTMNRTFFAACALLVTLAGCAGTSTVMMGDARPPIDPSQVRIYRTPPPDSIEIAQLESTSGVGFGTQGQTDAVIARLKREAAALGANGVILLGMGSGSSGGGMSVGAASYGSNGGAGMSMGIPTQQKYAAGMAIYVPPSYESMPAPEPEPLREPGPVAEPEQ